MKRHNKDMHTVASGSLRLLGGSALLAATSFLGSRGLAMYGGAYLDSIQGNGVAFAADILEVGNWGTGIGVSGVVLGLLGFLFSGVMHGHDDFKE